MKKFFPSESVTEGHPDKLCDQIADAVLDEIFLRDPDAHVACEVVITNCCFLYLKGRIFNSPKKIGLNNAIIDISEV